MKQRLSSKHTLWYKRLYPTFSFGLPLLIVGLFYWHSSREAWHQMGPVVMGVAVVILFQGLFMSRKFAFEPVEAVWMEDDALIVRHKGKEERVPMLDVVRMTPSRYMNPKRLTIELSRPSAFGESITFILPGEKERPMLEEFVKRLNQVHQGAQGGPGNSEIDVPPAQA